MVGLVVAWNRRLWSWTRRVYLVARWLGLAVDDRGHSEEGEMAWPSIMVEVAKKEGLAWPSMSLANDGGHSEEGGMAWLGLAVDSGVQEKQWRNSGLAVDEQWRKERKEKMNNGHE